MVYIYICVCMRTTHEAGVSHILELNSFNLAMLGKWRWKFLSNSNWGGAKVLQFNYNEPNWDLFRRPKGRVSFFWSGVSKCLPAFRGCVTIKVHSGFESLFWKDRWFNSSAPMHLWPEEFQASTRPNGSVRELAFLLSRLPFMDALDTVQLFSGLGLSAEIDKDLKLWSLMMNGVFTIKSFYYFHNEGGLRCAIANYF